MVNDASQEQIEREAKSSDTTITGNVCNECGTNFTRRDNYIRHMRKKHPTEVIPNGKVVKHYSSCLECNLDFKNVSELKVHLSTDHAFEFKVEEKEFDNQGG